MMNYRMIDIRTVETSGKGFLSFLEAQSDIPFEIQHVYYICGSENMASAKKYADRGLAQIMFCLAGVIEVVLDDGNTREQIVLDNPAKGLVLTGFIWQEIIWKTKDAVLAVAASDHYRNTTRISSYEQFLTEVKTGIKADNTNFVFDLENSGQCHDIALPSEYQTKRIYFIYDVPEGIKRGGHAHRKLQQTLTCPHGAVEVMLDDGKTRKLVVLDNPKKQLQVGAMIWHDMVWLKPESVLLVSASNTYCESDYIRNYEDFETEMEHYRECCLH